MAIDPVCGMEVDEHTAIHTSEYRGQTYNFCALGCKRAFDTDPEQYLAQRYNPAGDDESSDSPRRY